LIILTHVVSSLIQPSFELLIHNRCSNVDFVDRKYVSGAELISRWSPSDDAYAGDTMITGFTIKSDNASYGILTCRLRRNQTHESTETGGDTSNVVYLLVVWRISGSKELYADVLLVEYYKKFTWNKDELEKLYNENCDWFKKYVTITDTWSIYDNMTLKTSFKVRSLKGKIELNIYISEEERDNYAIRPLCFDLKR
jgi:hypothetical protein